LKVQAKILEDSDLFDLCIILPEARYRGTKKKALAYIAVLVPFFDFSPFFSNFTGRTMELRFF
jgi:hypothetical protein